MQTLTSTPKLSLAGTSLVQLTDGAGDLSNVTVESLDTNIARVGGTVFALGQATMAASLPVVIASNQTNLPANITQLVGAAFSATNYLPNRLTDGSAYYDARQIRALTNSDVVKAQLQDNAGTAITLGQKVMASSVPVVIASNQTYVPAGIVVGTVYDPSGNALTVKSASATYNPPTAGDQATALVAAVVGKKISVLAYNVQLGVSSANTFLRNGAGGTQLSVLFLRATGGSVPTAYIEGGSAGVVLFATTAGTALVTNCATNTGTVSIQVTYVEL